MKNISFDNPYLLLVAIPLVLAVVIPFIISVSKDNNTAGWKISLSLHLAISIIVTLAIAGLSSVTVLTKTTVYVVADVSHSSSKNLDQIDEYIQEIKENLPANSSIGVVCFGRDSIVLTPAGRAIKSVSEATVDDSATDIVSALNYTNTLFKAGTLKRIVLITDGNDTVNENAGGLASTVEKITEGGTKIDTIFINSTLKDGECEVQISSAEFIRSTYIDQPSVAQILIQSSESTNAMVNLYVRLRGASEYELLTKRAVTVSSGLTTVTFDLPTDKSGTFEYKAELVADSDISEHNNAYTFTQAVVDKMKVLLLTASNNDRYLLDNTYGDRAEIDTYFVNRSNSNVPFMIEELATYDEIILSGIDIRNINNANAFIDSLDIVVSQYGKSLTVMGDMNIQDEPDDPIFKKFSEILPIEYGNSAREGKLYTIVLDVSHSMYFASKFFDAQAAAIKLLSLLNDDDYICLVTFSGEVSVKTPQLVGECKEKLTEYINSLSTAHGTDIGVGLEEALKAVKNLGLSENQVMLISDGRSFDSTVDSLEIAKELFDYGTPVSAITIFGGGDPEEGEINMRNIVAQGEGGVYAKITAGQGQVDRVVFGTVVDNITESVITKNSSVNIVRYKDPLVSGLRTLPNINGYIQSYAKYDATVPITVDYVKPSGYEVEVPLYAYRSHGNGRISCLTTSLSGSWTSQWSNDQRADMLTRILDSNIPKENIDYPFRVVLTKTDFETHIELVPSVLYPGATARVKITFPGGNVITRELAFNSQTYSYAMESVNPGAYKLEITYTVNDTDYPAVMYFDIPYLAEYDAFAIFDKAAIYEFMRNNGTINEGQIPSLENDPGEISTYKVSYAIPLLIAAIVLFIADIVLRTLKIRNSKKAKRRKGEIV